MNSIVLSGRIASDVKANNGTASFDLCVKKKKDKDGITPVFYVRVKVFRCEYIEKLQKGVPVMLSGQLDIYKYNDKYYTEVLCNSWDLAFAEVGNNRYQQERQQEPPHGGYREYDEEIEF